MNEMKETDRCMGRRHRKEWGISLAVSGATSPTSRAHYAGIRRTP